MGKSDKPNRVEQLVEQVTGYVNLRIDAFKLAMVENLSTLSGNMLGIVIFLLLALMALLLLTVAATYALGLWIGSMVGAMLIMAALYLIAGLIVLLNRQRLFTDQMVRMFSRMFFERNDNPDDDGQ
ncbi:MAG: phage holin family protein [Rikenellaceae bacterium]|nr:phage holin family protein [Rikenellaceae bacterium]